MVRIPNATITMRLMKFFWNGGGAATVRMPRASFGPIDRFVASSYTRDALIHTWVPIGAPSLTIAGMLTMTELRGVRV